MNNKKSENLCGLLARFCRALLNKRSGKIALSEFVLRVVAGENPILVRAEQAGVPDTRLAKVMGISYATLRALENHPDGSCHALGREAVAKFCDYYKISPAHLVPLIDNPFLSLPTGITEEILSRLKINPLLAPERAAIDCEKKRYHRFGEHPLFVDPSRWFSQLEGRSDFMQIFNSLGKGQGRTRNFENLASLGLEVLLDDILQSERMRRLNQEISNRRLALSSAELREATFNLFGAEHEGYVSSDLVRRVDWSLSEIFSGRETLETTISLVSCQVSSYFLFHEFRRADAIWSRFGWQPPSAQDFQDRVREYLEARMEFRERQQREEEFQCQGSSVDRVVERKRLESWIEQIAAPSGVCVRRLVANHALITQFEQQNMQARNEIVIPAATHHFNG
jgi:hypothetical protein